MATPQDTPMTCPCCGDEATKTCSGCRDIRYCSAACQKSDWKIHKHLCKSLGQFPERPRKDMRRAIYFPPDGDKPVFTWLETYPGIGCAHVETEGIIDFGRSKGSISIPLNVRTMRPLSKRIELHYDDEFNFNYDCQNPALRTACNDVIRVSWRGPLLAYTGATSAETGDIMSVEDFPMHQYSALMAYLIKLNECSHESLNTFYRQLVAKKIQAARIVEAAKRLPGRPVFEGVEINEDHPAYLVKYGRLAKVIGRGAEPGEISPISQRIGMPLVAWKYPTLKMPSTQNKQGNEEVTAMFINIDTNEDQFGFAPLDWNGPKVADVLLTRGDQKTLDPDTAAAFAAYCHYHILPFVERALVKGSATKQYINRALEEVTPEKWALFQEQWQKLQAKSAEVGDTLVAGKPRMGLTLADYRSVVARFLP
ncbi:Protein CBFA2T1 [Pseudocercospora fuligena]|uniref:Protein CBFA2T1 n=1 Tax=Pseudocercospora fuligena TaxID=685502 RepID=A0A8H6RU98_9PEZI|nr:Protein CBFA2T1 [Pseudocercospora fuligena]